MQKEEWKPIIGYEGFYEVSDHGRVRSMEREAARIAKAKAEEERKAKELAEAKAASEEHRRQVRREAAAALHESSTDLDSAEAASLVLAIEAGEIPHVSIDFSLD